MLRTGLLLLVVLAITGRRAWPQGNPLGPEFRVNTFTTANQYFPAIATDAAGNFVVVWQSYAQDGWGRGIFGQRYSSTGAPLGPEFRVNSYTSEHQTSPSVASDAAGNFVVVWSSSIQNAGLFGQRYDASGAPLGSEFRVNTSVLAEYSSSVASDTVGNLVMVWEGLQDGSFGGIFGQRYDSSGATLGPEFRVNAYTTGDQYNPAVASDGSGKFIVVWASNMQDGSGRAVFGQRYAISGTPLGPEFRVNTYTTWDQLHPSVASDATGNFVVVWDSYQDGFYTGIFGQRYAASGAPVGPEFRVNTFTLGHQHKPSVASDSGDNFVVVWRGYIANDYGISGQRYAASGAPLGSEFHVNTYTSFDQTDPAVASNASGNFVVIWQSYLQDGSNYGIFGQRYGQIVPVELTRFAVE